MYFSGRRRLYTDAIMIAALIGVRMIYGLD